STHPPPAPPVIQKKQPPASSPSPIHFSPQIPAHRFSSLLPPSGPPASSHAAMLGSLQSGYGNQFVQQVVQRKCRCGGSCRECSGEDAKQVQRKANDPGASGGNFATSPVPRSSAGSPLPPGVRAKMEERFGQNFADVRVHDDPAA